LFRLGFVALLALTACDTAEPASVDAAPIDMTGWRLASGKVPTKAEFVALTATCRDKGGALDPCLATLGLKRGP
jgi:hypothetical protein